jgi:hypothetical protein
MATYQNCQPIWFSMLMENYYYDKMAMAQHCETTYNKK